MNELSYTKEKKPSNWAQETASVFKILADSTRCKILKLLVQNKEGMYVGDIAEAISVSHSAVSHQLNALEDRGVLVSVREGQSICYALAQNRLARNIERVLVLFF